MFGFVNVYYKFCVWTTRFVYVNLLWIAFSLLGLIVFGFMPATVAMFAVVRKWIMKEEDISVLGTFWEVYRREFIKVNGLGFILFIIGYLLSIELHVLQAQDSFFYLIASFGVVALYILYLIVLLYFFPIFVHFNLKTYQYIKWSFVIGMIHPILTLCLLVGVFLINYIIFMTIPALVCFFGGSITAFILMWGVSKTFPRFEQRET